MILTPKRKLITNTPVDEPIETLIQHTKETVITEFATGYRAPGNIFILDHRLKIPVGTDMYD